MKKELSCLIVLLLQILVWFPVQARVVSLGANEIKHFETCEAPPPDSLRVTVKGTHFMVLEWKPAFEGADHYLEVFEKTEEGDWELYQTYESVVTASKRIDGLMPGKRYRFKVATKCGTNDPSVFSTYIDDSTLILELTLNGRRPIEPQVKGDCEPLEYLDPKNEWVGYRVTYVENGVLIQNFFEFVSSEENGGEAPQLRRFMTYNPIVAANTVGRYPREIDPLVDLLYDEYVSMQRVNGASLYHFGSVDIQLQPSSHLVSICIAPTDPPWNELFVFEPMTARKAQEIIPGGQSMTESNSELFSIENHFWGNLKLHLPSFSALENGNNKLTIIDVQGRCMFSQKNIWGELELSVDYLPDGVYFVCFETAKTKSILKTIKFN